jgi:hypothetical protein
MRQQDNKTARRKEKEKGREEKETSVKIEKIEL